LSLILTSNLIFGFMFVIRIVKQSAKDPLIPCKVMPKIGTALICSQIFVAFFEFTHPFFAIATINALTFASMMCKTYLNWRSRSILSREFFVFLQDLVMNLKLGLAFAKSCQMALHERSELFSTSMRRLLSAQSIYIGQSRGHLFLSTRALEELRGAEQKPHTALKRLTALRDEQQLLSDFRRKSGQATAQARIQCTILWILLLALGIGVIAGSGWEKSQKFIIVALSLFVTGQFAFNRVIRKTKWNV
jgi:hypothetical protein